MSKKNVKCVYVIAAENGPVKISISKDPDARIHTLEKQSGRLISSRYVSHRTVRPVALKRRRIAILQALV